VAGMPATTAPPARRPDDRAEAPIFREMEAVWFRSHGNDSTAIFTRPQFDQPPPAAQPAAQPAAAAPTGVVPPVTTTSGLPTRTPGSSSAPATQPPPPSYTPPVTTPAPTPQPAAPPAAAAAAPAAEPATAGNEAWRTAADEGWARATRAAEPATSGTTRSGLPKRTPSAQLVPGGVEPKGGPDRSRRTPDQVRGLLSAYHRGVQRGRTAGTEQNSTSTKETSG